MLTLCLSVPNVITGSAKNSLFAFDVTTLMEMLLSLGTFIVPDDVATTFSPILASKTAPASVWSINSTATPLSPTGGITFPSSITIATSIFLFAAIPSIEIKAPSIFLSASVKAVLVADKETFAITSFANADDGDTAVSAFPTLSVFSLTTTDALVATPPFSKDMLPNVTALSAFTSIEPVFSGVTPLRVTPSKGVTITEAVVASFCPTAPPVITLATFT